MTKHNKMVFYVLIFFTIFFFNNSFAVQAQEVGKHIDDGVIVSKIYSAYILNKSPRPFKIKVKSKDGAITLSGKVNTDQAYINAIKVAQSVNGVKSVNAENLNINRIEKPSKDLLITTKIESQLVKNNIFDINDIKLNNVNVETKDGNVQLTGKVYSLAKKKKIVNISKSVSGVKSIH